MALWLSCLVFCVLIPSAFLRSPLEKNFLVNANRAVQDVVQSDYRLPTTVIPSSYDLLIVPYFDTFTFKGQTTIQAITQATVSEIILNQKDLNIDSVNVTTLDGTNLKSNYTVNNTLERFTIVTETLYAGLNFTISINYSGNLTDNMLGFYRSSYVENNVTKTLAITQFESTFARQAFPCFDEPAFRAAFTVHLGRDSNQISLSNYPLVSTSKPLPAWDNKVVDTFQQTASMPTYLVAFSVNEFANLTDNKFRIFMRPDVKTQGEYLRSIGQNILDTIADFLNYNYTLPKMDVVAVPDFDAGAMENWGLTTYREKYVLYDSKVNSAADKQLLVAVVAHEFGHQWFGDLVTPEWWSYSWLNEAFATYFEYVTPSIMEPTWGMLEQYVYDNVQSSMADDVGDPRPMTANVSTPTEIDNVFDYVIYEKGGSILRMAEHFLTTPVWKAGLYAYLNANKYSTGNPDKLFDRLENAASETGVLPEGVEVNRVLQTWTTQPGYPVVTVNTATTPLTLTQAPFALDAKYANLSWWVPLSYTTQEVLDFNTTTPSYWLVPDSGSPIINGSSGWIIFNIQQTGFYRVNYDSNNWQKLTDQMNNDHIVIGTINRAQLLDDSFNLARYGQLDYSVPLGLTQYLPKEGDYLPWMSAANNLNYLTTRLYGTDLGNNLMVYARNLLTDNFIALTNNTRSASEPHLTTLTRLRVVTWACNWQHPACESYADDIFKQWYNNQTNFTIPTDVKESVFCTGLRLNNDYNMFLAVWQYYLNSNNYADKLSVMNALGCSTSEQGLLTYLGYLLTNGIAIRRQDKWIVFRAVVQRQSGISTGMKFLVENYDKLIQNIGEKRVGSMVSSLASNLVQAAHIEQFKAVIANSSYPANLRNSMNSSLPGIEKAQAWATTYQSNIAAWVNANTNNDTGSSASTTTSGLILNLSLITVLSFYYKYLTSV